ncbi:MAG TPA: ABC transporter substrate-binding protein [Acidimicrobiales bacterium]|nr:ABC transporter substrate-binding protein [Acidimicrobiales bacterium]
MLTLSAIVALALSSCGGSSKTASGTTSTTAASGPVNGGTLTVGEIFDAFSLDPTKMIGSVTDGTIGLTLYDPLTDYDAQGNVQPWLAQSLTTTDQQTWTMKLRPGVTFSDGSPFNSAAVVFNINRHKDPANGSREIFTAQQITSVSAPDDLTVVFKLKDPWSDFPGALAGPLGFMASPTAIQKEGADYGNHPVGTGPFTLVEWVKQDHLTVQRNPHYWRPGEPHLDQIVFRPIVDRQTRVASVVKGETQVGQTINIDDVATAQGVGSSVSPPQQNLIVMNTKVAPFNDVRVRQALAYATDTSALNKVVFGGHGTHTPAFIENDSPYLDPSVKWPSFDPAKAIQLIKSYEAEHGAISFTYSCYTDPDQIKMTALLQQMWQQVGLKITTKTSDQQTFVVSVFLHNYQVACFGGAATSDPDAAYYPIFFSTSATNWTQFSNPQLDAALTTGHQSADPNVRRTAYDTAQQILAEQVPEFATVASPWGWLFTRSVHGLVDLSDGTFFPSEVWLSH